ncbi:HlyD family efflux transporter periplasmic adaptor subunit [Planktothrix sp. FACHB-1355]|uniref:HlyD family efflux transporter periplasmic adaptor subunit n=1 Tax=Aerosakkonema funiforme FACHB-1375 TaxID=2949571 RepID=A0A926ZIM5_9CYAN|nr:MULTISPECIES: HlyD family efflux transporter periplasmic adaptor subunit [Oscillatoriales]MBD2183819.1 HlyD family efflux transporter periplasmic adaptor subunit [Aerosakkonema funiforme FACHB-1375]MBD3558288.1 HlyD family efflux transporter periplasmic adaptor subunit [Planktothrix sp. FACHB-1355]
MTNKQIVDSHSHNNGNGKNNSATQVKDLNTVWIPPEAVSPAPPPPAFEPDNQPILLERPSWWSHAFVWLIVSVSGTALLWAAFAPLEQSVPATGKLEAEGAAKELKAPNGGVVREILVKDGDAVTKGQLLVTLDPTAPQADLDSLLKQRETLLRENQFYNAQFTGASTVGSPEFQALTQSRAALLAENQYLKAQLNGAKVSGGQGDFFANQDGLLAASRAELRSRVEAARLQVQELQTQLAEVQVQLAATEAQLPTANQQLAAAKDRLTMAGVQLETAKAQVPRAKAQLEMAKAQVSSTQARLQTARAQIPNASARVATAAALLNSDKDLLNRIEPVAQAGALAELQLKRQQQQVLLRQNELAQSESERLTRQSELAATETEILTRQNEITAREADVLSRYQEIAAIQAEISNRQGEVAAREGELVRTQGEVERLKGERQRITVSIERAKQQLKNTIDLSAKDIFTKIADNHKRVADIDSQLGRLRLENKKKLDEIESQIQKAKQAVQYQELRSPVDGIVFDLKPNSSGYVVRAIDSEPVLKVVPTNKLVAKVYLTNRDIGQVVDRLNKDKELKVEVNVESFPSTEYGTITGKLTSVSSDVLPPDQQEQRPYYAFPATIELETQTLKMGNREIKLQPGMAINASIKVRNRTVLSIFTELFQKQVDSLESVR